MSSADLLHVTGFTGKRRIGDQRIRGVVTDSVGPRHSCSCGCPAAVEEYDDTRAGIRWRVTRCQGAPRSGPHEAVSPRCKPIKTEVCTVPKMSNTDVSRYRALENTRQREVAEKADLKMQRLRQIVCGENARPEILTAIHHALNEAGQPRDPDQAPQETPAAQDPPERTLEEEIKFQTSWPCASCRRDVPYREPMHGEGLHAVCQDCYAPGLLHHTQKLDIAASLCDEAAAELAQLRAELAEATGQLETTKMVLGELEANYGYAKTALDRACAEIENLKLTAELTVAMSPLVDVNDMRRALGMSPLKVSLWDHGRELQSTLSRMRSDLGPDLATEVLRLASLEAKAA